MCFIDNLVMEQLSINVYMFLVSMVVDFSYHE